MTPVGVKGKAVKNPGSITETSAQRDLEVLQESLNILGNSIDRQYAALRQLGPARPNTPQAFMDQSLKDMKL